jgi:YD repeat-containing protein
MESQTAEDMSVADARARKRTSQSRQPPAGLRSLFTTCLITLLLVSTCAALATTYIYDPNGRLAVVTNDAGESARYRYDELGNLVAIERLAVDDLAVFGFSPGRGAAGVAVRISGQGFSPTAGQNTVRFNGTVASVSTASNTALTAVVPAGATTGPITVTVGSETASSTTDFIVDENARPPVITNVGPLIASVGTAITVDGQTLAPVVNQTTLRLNWRRAVPTTLTNLQAAFPVPSGTSSGRVSVTTPYGTAVSNQDVLVTPDGILPGEIAQLKRLALDATAQGFSVVTAGHYSAALFDGSSGDYLSAQFSSISVASISYKLYGVSNTLLANGIVSSSSPTFHLPQLPATGTYLLLMRPATVPATWNVAIEKVKPVVTGGESLPLETTIAGHRKLFTFTALAGQDLGLGISDLVLSNGSYVKVFVYKPNSSSSLINTSCYTSNDGCGLNLPNLEAGTYRVEVQPSSSSQMMSFQATLSSDITGVIERDISAPLNLPRRGQNGRLTFAGTVGETVALQIAEQTTAPADEDAYYYVYKPDGTLLTSTTTDSAATLNLQNLPATGNYTLFVDPYYSGALTAQLLLVSGTTGDEETDGDSSTYTTTVPGQNVYFTFVAASGQNLGLGISDLSVSNGGYQVNVFVYKPDGTSLMDIGCYTSNGGCGLNMPNLEAGTYSVRVQPSNSSQIISFRTTLSSDITGVIERDVSAALNLPRHGQNGRLTFAGTAGETLALHVGEQTTVPAGQTTYYSVYKPDGTLLASANAYQTPGVTLNLPDLPVTGNYTLFVDPGAGETLSATTKLVAGAAGVVALDGVSSDFSTTVPGQNAYLTFMATAGQNLGLGLSDLVMPGEANNYVRFYVYRPNGTQLSTALCSITNNICQINLTNLTAGTYRVMVQAPFNGDRTMSFKGTLSTDKAATLTRNVDYALTLPRYGQNGRLTFAATQGESLVLRVAGQVTVPAGGISYYTVYKPDGTLLKSTSTTSVVGLSLPNLPATGNYTVFADPGNGQTMSAQVRIELP